MFMATTSKYVTVYVYKSCDYVNIVYRFIFLAILMRELNTGTE